MCVNPSLVMPEAVLGLGGNLGARRAIFRAAAELLASTPGCRVLARSQLYETPPLGPPQPDYLNAALRVSWAGPIEALLASTQRIEAQLGRLRRERWGARTLDVDVMSWSEGPVRTATLEVPHRELSTRTFALAPLLDVAPELAAVWAESLAELGGAPPRAVPGWPTLTSEPGVVYGDWQHDEPELASQLVELAALAPAPSACVAIAVARGAPLGTHAFTGPRELFDSDGRSWLLSVVNDALMRGFAVKSAAVLARDETHTGGVLLGYDGCPKVPLGVLALTLEGEPPGLRRLEMRLDTPERGFDFNGSGTM
jgi:2-amino-4-hydroxy-6-hydroxymethyldihydropteridine diphosphokinase